MCGFRESSRDKRIGRPPLADGFWQTRAGGVRIVVYHFPLEPEYGAFAEDSGSVDPLTLGLKCFQKR